MRFFSFVWNLFYIFYAPWVKFSSNPLTIFLFLLSSRYYISTLDRESFLFWQHLKLISSIFLLVYVEWYVRHLVAFQIFIIQFKKKSFLLIQILLHEYQMWFNSRAFKNSFGKHELFFVWSKIDSFEIIIQASVFCVAEKEANFFKCRL